MALFSRIHSLLRKGQSHMYEDLLTEVFADVLVDNEKLSSFMKEFIGIKLENPTGTQKTFLRLDGHDTDSRPDLVVQFKDLNRNYILFFENKIDASEGHNQLRRYAEHLKSFKDKGWHTFLIYITRRDDSKREKDVFVNGITAEFVQIRWYEIYNWLKTQRDAYIDKIINYMGEIGLDQSRKFLPQDIYAIQEMDRLQRMMDECLDGPVDDVMTKLFGRARGWSNRNVQLRDYCRYFKIDDQGNRLMWVGCGFYISEEEYPLVCVTYEVNPNYEDRDEVIEAMKEFIKGREDWEGYDIDDDTEWSGITCDKYLLDFLKEEDHIIAIQEFFIEKLKELYLIKDKHPDLNWKEV